MEDKKCKDLVEGSLNSRMEDLRLLWAGYCNEDCPKCDGTGIDDDLSDSTCETPCKYCEGNRKLNEDVPDLGNLFEYGLCFDYVAPFTWKEQSEGYFRFQISWGGPSEEFRIFANKNRHGWQVYRIEFWYLDWFDGAKINLHGDDLNFMTELSEQFFLECSGNSVYEKAMEDWEAPEDEDDEEN